MARFDPLRVPPILWARKPWQRESNALRARADSLRRAGDFAAAIPLYQQYLERRPDHATAWMLFGHCLKETGLLAEADDAYARAVKLGRRNLDAWVARAHFLKNTGRRVEAYHAFETAVTLGGDLQTAMERDALKRPGITPAADAGVGLATIWIDISDLLEYIAGNLNVSGIQRVQASLMEYALGHPDQVCCVLTRPWDPEVWSISRRSLGEILALLARGAGGGEAMRDVLARLRKTVAAAPLRPGCTLFQAGAFWIGNGNPPLHRAARLAGMRVTALIHDLIPIDMPEVCAYENVRDFSAALAEALHSFDAVLANSQHSADSVVKLIAAKGLAPRPVVVVPLAHGAPPAPGAKPRWSRQIAMLRGKPFVLSVGTVEPRKNHLLLLKVWQQLVAEGLDPPLLVIIGKLGWMTGDFVDEMRRSHGVDGRVIHLRGISDMDLETLYAACEFTAFPSLTEGWGLPVGESLARGKLCVTSDRGALPEVGGDFAIYISAFDVEAAAAVFRRMLTDKPWRAAAQARLDTEFRPRGWTEVAANMVRALDALPTPSPVALDGPAMPIGTLYRPLPVHVTGGATALGLDPFVYPLRVMLADRWLNPGVHGVPMGERRAPLRLVVPEPALLRIEVYGDGPLRLTVGGESWPLRPQVPTWLEWQVEAGPVEIFLEAVGEPERMAELPPGLYLTTVELRRVAL
jgi:glycosyltransferase involved in cell wall biosynthesis